MNLNNKGFTVVEVLITFVLVSIVMISLFSTISAFNEKRIQESYRARIYEYKNSIVNTIQSDFIQKGLSHASIVRTGSSNSKEGMTYTVYCTLRDGTERILVVHQRFTKTSFRFTGSTEYSDDYYIEYGTKDEMIREEFPELGETVGEYRNDVHAFVENPNSQQCKKEDGSGGREPCVQKNFQINNISINITNEADINAESHVLNIYIGFYHFDVGTKYAINIVSPIEYQAGSSSPDSRFPIGNEEWQIHQPIVS